MTAGDAGRTAWRSPRTALVGPVVGMTLVVAVFVRLGSTVVAGPEIAEPRRVLVLAVGVLVVAVPYWLVSLAALVSGTGVDLTPEGVVLRKPGGRVFVAWSAVVTIRTDGLAPAESILLVTRSEDDVVATGMWRFIVPRSRPPKVPGYLAVPPRTVEDASGLDAALRRRLGVEPRVTAPPPPPVAQPIPMHQASAPAAPPHVDVATLVAPPFPRVRVREGYDVGEVDAFAAELLERARQRPPAITADEVESVVFTPVRVRQGYDMGSVDRWLDRVVSELRRR